MATGDRALPTVVGAALGVVVATGLLFAGIGALRGSDDVADGGQGVTPIAGGSEETSEDGSADGGDDEGTTVSPVDELTATDDTTDGESSADDPESADDDASTADGASTSDEPTASDEPSTDEAPSTDDETTSEQPAVDPGSIDIQVLDGVGNDNRRSARAVADELEAAGYNVVVINSSAVRYDVTTVFWTEGEGPAGRAVATLLGTDEARTTPDEVRLSDSVAVHVVVGADR